MIEECSAHCWCEFCESVIKKGDIYLNVIKSSWKGKNTRTNICRKCLIRIFIELRVNSKEIGQIKKEQLLEELK